MSGFELPSNIRQIGGVDEHLRIYVEDYAVSYLKRYAETGGESDRVAFLVGKYMVIDSQGYLFIGGAIQGKFTAFDEGAWTFSDESFEYAYSQVERYFEGYEIVGWMQSQPGYGTSLNPVCADYHMNNFIKPYQALFVVDPTEKLESFYIWDKTMSAMNEAKGYFVYYDRNRGMQEYMLDNKLTNVRGFSKGKTANREETEGRSGSEDKSDTAASAGSFTSRTRGTAGRAASRKITKPERGEVSEYKRLVNMMVSLSAVLFVIAFIMGAGLMQSDSRLGAVEEDMASLNGAYDYVLAQLSQAVFAPSDSQSQSVIPDNSFIDNDIINSGQANSMNLVNEPVNDEINGGTANADDFDNGEEQSVNELNQNNSQDSDISLTTMTPNANELSSSIPSPTPTPVTTPPPARIPSNDGANIELPSATIPPSQTPIPIPTQPPSGNTQSGSARPLFNENPLEYDTYTVQRGDNLSSICYRYYGTTDMLEKVMEVNNITQPDMIYYGKVLYMPKSDVVAEPQ